MNNQSMKRKKRPVWTRLVKRIFSMPSVRISDNAQWKHLTTDERNLCQARIQRLNQAYLSHYRRKGNLKLPEIHEVTDQAVFTRCSEEKPDLAAHQVRRRFENEQIDVLLRTILVQLDQLESIGYVHCALSPKKIILRETGNGCRALITGLEHGRFTDEDEALAMPEASDYISPETCCRVMFPGVESVPERNDVFSAGCLYYQFLTGRALRAPAESVVRMTPVFVGGMDGPRASLIRWMLEPNSAKRPCAADVLDAMNEMKERALLNGERSFDDSTFFTLKEYELCPGRIGSAYAQNQCLAADQEGNMLIVRCLTDYWNPGDQPDEGEGILLALHRKIYEWNMRRLQLVVSRSTAWHKIYPLIASCSAHKSRLWPILTAPLSGKQYVALEELNRYHDSVFLLDARMTEILFAVQVLHDDRFILGALSPALFGAKIGEHGAQVELLDLSGAFSLDDLPEPEAVLPDEESIRFLSPELAQYIASSPVSGSDELMDMQDRIGPASDIFALGLIYHLILTGHLPGLRRPEYGSCANAICYEETPGDALVLDESIDRKHSELILTMLTMNPLERPMRCDEIIRRILNFYTA